MKFQIDTNLKTIKLEEKALLKEVLDIMKAMFPDDWKEYTIETNTVINWLPYERIKYVSPWWDLQPYYSNGGYVLTNCEGTLNQGYNSTGSYITSCNGDTPNIINVETNI